MSRACSPICACRALAGAELLARVAQIRPHCRRAVVTGFPESEDLITAINAGHLHYVITKPWKLQDLLQVVDQLVHTFKLERDNDRLARRAAAREHAAPRARARARGAARRARPRDLGGDRAARADGPPARRAHAARRADRPLHAPRVPGAAPRGGRARAALRPADVAPDRRHRSASRRVNYDLGYQVGDEILRRIARRAPGGRLARSRAHLRRRRALLRRGVRAAPARDREGRRAHEGGAAARCGRGRRDAGRPQAVDVDRRRVLARRRRRSRGPAHRRRGRAARRQARRPRPRALLLRRATTGRARRAQPAVRPHARARDRSVPPVPGADERGDGDPRRAIARCRACSSICRACTASSSISASRTTARSTITRPRCSIGCAARCSIRPT